MVGHGNQIENRDTLLCQDCPAVEGGHYVAITPAEFAVKWMGSTATERAAAQEHFIDLCRLLGVPTPNEAVQGRTGWTTRPT
jgi:hypothetical protein